MIVAVGAFKHSRNKVVAQFQIRSADRASPWNVFFKTGETSAYVHQAVPAAGHGRKGQGFYQVPPVQPVRANRANLRIAGSSFFVLFFSVSPWKTAGVKGGERAKKYRVSKPNQDDTGDNQS
jgi:hypothetical protein